MSIAPADFAATSRFAEANGMRVHYHEAGPAEGTPVVMLHGGGPGASAWSNFGPNLPAFASHFRTLMVDQPGFGRSGRPWWGTTSRSPPTCSLACSASWGSNGCICSATHSAGARRSVSR